MISTPKKPRQTVEIRNLPTVSPKKSAAKTVRTRGMVKPSAVTSGNARIPRQKNLITNEVIDTLILARDKFPGSPVSLDALCKRYRIDNSSRTQHTALIDCDLLAKVYINLIDQKEPTLNFQNQDVDTKDKNNTKVSYFKKVIKPSEKETLNHKEYLKNHLKKNYFN